MLIEDLNNITALDLGILFHLNSESLDTIKDRLLRSGTYVLCDLGPILAVEANSVYQSVMFLRAPVTITRLTLALKGQYRNDVTAFELRVLLCSFDEHFGMVTKRLIGTTADILRNLGPILAVGSDSLDESKVLFIGP